MKDLLDFLFKTGNSISGLILKTIGVAAICLFILSNIKEYSWITKAMVLYLFTH